MPADDTVLACPDCDSTGIRARVQNGYGAPTHENDYYCRHCGHSFDDPVERERHDESGLPGLAGRLDRMDPDDVGDDDGLVTDGGRSLDERLTRLEREVFDDEDEDPEIRADGGQSVSETERSWDGGGQKTIREESMERRRNSRGISRSAVAGLIEEHGESGVLYLRNERKYASIWLRIVETQVWSYTEQASGATFTRETTLSNILRHKRGEYEVVGADEAPIEWKTVADGDGNFCDVHTETDHDIRTDGGAREMRYAGCSVPLRRGFTDLTIRLASEWRDLTAGDRLDIVTDDDTVPVTVTETQACAAADAYLIANAADGHVSYGSFGEFLATFAGYYPEAGVDAETRFVCVGFEVDADAALDHAESDPQEVDR